MHSPEQVETTNATTQAIRPTARAVQRSEEDGKHHESQNDTSESRATQLDVEDLQGKSLTSHEIETVLDGWNLLAETVWELFRLSFLISPDSF